MAHPIEYDVVVIGARCAGAAHARLLADAGLKVLVVERGEEGSDTLSSHAMTRGAALQLSRWGILPKVVASGTPAIERSVFRFGPQEMPVDIRPLENGPGMLAPRRYKLDAMLAEAARDAGAEIRFRTGFRDVLRDTEGRIFAVGLTSPEGWSYSVRTKFLVGADGLRSSVAKAVGAAEDVITDKCLAHVYGYFALPDQCENLFAFAPGLSVGITPTDGGMSIVIVSGDPQRMRQEIRANGAESALLNLTDEIDPALGARLRGAQMPERARLFAGHPTIRRKSSGPGWALIGDAGQFRDPVTAHGMTDALRDAEHLATCLLEDGFDASTYERERNAVSDPIFALTADMVTYDDDMPVLSAKFIELSRLMREEQAWMKERFARVAIAA